MDPTGSNTSFVRSVGPLSIFIRFEAARCMSSIVRKRSLIKEWLFLIMRMSSRTDAMDVASTNGGSVLTSVETKESADIAADKGFRISLSVQQLG